MTHTPHEIQSAAQDVATVAEIDNAIIALGELVHSERSEIGDKVRGLVGRNVFNQFTNEKIGELIAKSLQMALLQRRVGLVEKNKSIVIMQAPPELLAVACGVAEDPPHLR